MWLGFPLESTVIAERLLNGLGFWMLTQPSVWVKECSALCFSTLFMPQGMAPPTPCTFLCWKGNRSTWSQIILHMWKAVGLLKPGQREQQQSTWMNSSSQSCCPQCSDTVPSQDAAKADALSAVIDCARAHPEHLGLVSTFSKDFYCYWDGFSKGCLGWTRYRYIHESRSTPCLWREQENLITSWRDSGTEVSASHTLHWNSLQIYFLVGILNRQNLC